MPVLWIDADPQSHMRGFSVKRVTRPSSILAKTTLSLASMGSGSWKQTDLRLNRSPPPTPRSSSNLLIGVSLTLQKGQVSGEPQTKSSGDTDGLF